MNKGSVACGWGEHEVSLDLPEERHLTKTKARRLFTILAFSKIADKAGFHPEHGIVAQEPAVNRPNSGKSVWRPLFGPLCSTILLKLPAGKHL